MPICGMLMRVRRWTRDFKADMESTLTPVLITLPDLPWKYYDWPALDRILDPIGMLIALDKATLDLQLPRHE